jgi:hypothetical protein
MIYTRCRSQEPMQPQIELRTLGIFYRTSCSLYHLFRTVGSRVYSSMHLDLTPPTHSSYYLKTLILIPPKWLSTNTHMCLLSVPSLLSLTPTTMVPVSTSHTNISHDQYLMRQMMSQTLGLPLSLPDLSLTDRP